MSSLTPFLLVATLVAAVGAGTVTQARPAPHAAASAAQARPAAARASVTVDAGVLVLAAR